MSVIDVAVLELLRCPVTLSRLRLEGDPPELVGEVGGLRYPIRDGIPVMLAESAKLPVGFETLAAFRERFGRA